MKDARGPQADPREDLIGVYDIGEDPDGEAAGVLDVTDLETVAEGLGGTFAPVITGGGDLDIPLGDGVSLRVTVTQPGPSKGVDG